MNPLLRYLYKKRSTYYSKAVMGYIEKGEKVLDIGAGSGYLAEILSKKADITLLDINDYNQTKLPLKLYNGKNIPFKDNSFDVAILLTVLHYSTNPEEFLKEIKRVCKRIIIVDDEQTTGQTKRSNPPGGGRLRADPLPDQHGNGNRPIDALPLHVW
ncbi:MAG: methyltransferase domain-containing protein [Nanoarchaeota archaeon]|nr:methyltransferase domain-containing protein [Nanoarchaeota archaeon]